MIGAPQDKTRAMPGVRRLKRTVLIGLGGTGKKALLHAKKRFLETFGEEPPLVKYLLIDTTSANTDHLVAQTSAGEKPVRLRADEILHIEARGASLLPRVHDEIREWFPPKADLKANILSGAGQIRALGRLALFANATVVYENLRDLLALARDYRDERPSGDWQNIYEPYTPHLTVALVGSLAGGTGSGIFLDVAFVLRQLMKDEDQLFGHFLLPDIYVNRPGTQNVEANAYAAIKELDYFMSLEDTFRYRFGGREVEVRKKPFDMVFLVNRQNRAGKTFNEIDDLMELLGLGLYLSAGPLGKEQADTFDNIVHKLNEQKGKYYGKTAHYASFGAAELRFEPEGIKRESQRAQALKALDKLLDQGYGWTPSAIHAKLEELKTLALQLKPEPLPVASSREEDRKLLPIVESQLEEVLQKHREALLHKHRESIRPFLRQEAAQALGQGAGLKGLEDSLQQLLQRAQALEKELKKEAATAKERRDKRLEDTQTQVNNNPARGFFGLGRQPQGAVLNRQTNQRIYESSADAGIQEGRKALATTWVQALDELLEEVRRASQRIQEYRSKLESENYSGTGQAQDVEPFTLTLPPPYVEQTGRVEVREDGGEIRWDLEALLRDPHAAIKQALEKSEAAAMAEWLNQALLRKDQDPGLWEAVERNLRELDRISDPAWDYEDAWVSNPGLGYREKVHILGVANASSRDDPFVGRDEILNLFASNLHDRMRLQRVSTGDPNRVLFYKMEASIPAFVLRGIQIYREKYEALARERSFHIHRDWEEGLEDLFPTPSKEEVAEVWTKARALGLLTNEVGYGFTDRRQGTARRHVLGTTPADAFAALRKDFFAFKELEAQVKKEEGGRRRDPEALEGLKLRLPEVIDSREQKLEDASFSNEDKEIFQQEIAVLKRWREELVALRPDAGQDVFPPL